MLAGYSEAHTLHHATEVCLVRKANDRRNEEQERHDARSQ
jgi:hypothetical protein